MTWLLPWGWLLFGGVANRGFDQNLVRMSDQIVESFRQNNNKLHQQSHRLGSISNWGGGGGGGRGQASQCVPYNVIFN